MAPKGPVSHNAVASKTHLLEALCDQSNDLQLRTKTHLKDSLRHFYLRNIHEIIHMCTAVVDECEE